MAQDNDFSVEKNLVAIFNELALIGTSAAMLKVLKKQSSRLPEDVRSNIADQMPKILSDFQDLVQSLLTKSQTGEYKIDDKFFEVLSLAYKNLKTILRNVLIDVNVPGGHIKGANAFRALDFLKKREENEYDTGYMYLTSESSASQKQIDSIAVQLHELEGGLKDLYRLYNKQSPVNTLGIYSTGKRSSAHVDDDFDNELIGKISEFDDNAELYVPLSLHENIKRLFSSIEPFTNDGKYLNNENYTFMEILVKKLAECLKDDGQIELEKALQHHEYYDGFKEFCFDRFYTADLFFAGRRLTFAYGVDQDSHEIFRQDNEALDYAFKKIVNDFIVENSPKAFLQGLKVTRNKLQKHGSSDGRSLDDYETDASSVTTTDSRLDGDSTPGSPRPVSPAKHLETIPELTGRQRSKSAVWIQHPGQAETKQRGRSNAVWKQGRERSDAIDETKQGRQRSDAIDQEPPNTGGTPERKRRKSF